MRRLLSLLLIFTLMVNVVGLYGIYTILQFQQHAAMTKLLDSNAYDPAMTHTFKIPVAIPYMENDLEFKRTEGVFEHHGGFYRLVKQKYENDTLTVVCIFDGGRTKLHHAVSDHARTLATTPGDHKNHTNFSFLKDYIAGTFSLGASSMGWQFEIICSNRFREIMPSSIARPSQPPERS